MTSSMDGDGVAGPAAGTTSGITTYHCPSCPSLLLATPSPIYSAPSRQVDQSLIWKVTDTASADSLVIYEEAVSAIAQPIVINLDDGYEKRYPMTCASCACQIAYHLDLQQFDPGSNKVGPREDVIYVLQGGVRETKDLAADIKKEPA